MNRDILLFRRYAMLLIVLAIYTHVNAQDTIRITLHQAEEQFLQKNLTLLTEKYNIDISRVQEIQARLYNNPNFSVSGNLYNPQRRTFLDVGNSAGQYEASLQQLIRLAGKRNKEIRLAETNTVQSENRFFDLLRTLRFSLRSNFYDAFYLQQSIIAYQNQVNSLEKMDMAYSELQKKGIVTLKDAVRIRALLYSLKADQASMRNQLNDLEGELQLLLQNNHAYYLLEDNDTGDLQAAVKQLNLQQLTDTAYTSRYDLKLAENDVVYNKQNYALQKAMAVPDLTVGAAFDKRGSFVDNATFLNVAMDLPFFHRNQGNIKAARLGITQSEMKTNLQKKVVENDVVRAYARLLNSNSILQSIDTGFQSQFDHLLEGITDNFSKKNISIIEFTDFYESYKNNVLQVNRLKNERMQAIEALNFAIGKTILNN